MSLEFDERGLLPVGVHDADLDEVEAAFSRFRRTDKRMRLFARLAEYVAELRRSAIPGHLIIDGSFVMDLVNEPGDIDIILVLAETWDMDAVLRPFQYNLVSKSDIKRDYGFDVIRVAIGSDDETRWTDFFSQVSPRWIGSFGWPASLRKGLVRVEL